MTPEDLMVISGLYGEGSKNAPAAGGLFAEENGAEAPSYSGGLDLGVNPARKRRTPLQNTMLTVADLFNISASRPNVFGQSALQPGSAYLGQSEEQANARQKTRMEEDPEGYQIDLNRAKLLSQKAQNETDPAKKAIFGREIKKLLPNETQGLDDLMAADFLVGDDKFKQKMQLEQLKGMNRLQLQQLKNSGNMDVATLKASSAEEINQAKLNTQWDIAALNNEYKKAIADGNNERAITVAQMITDRQTDLAMLNNAAKLKQTEMQQAGQTERTVIQQEGQTTRTFAQNASREEVARINAAGALERIQAQQAGALKRANIAAAKASTSGKSSEDQSMAVGFAENLNPDFLQKMYDLNEGAGRWETNRYNPSDKEQGWMARQYIGFTSDDYGIASSENTPEAQDFQEFEAYARQIVSNQLKKILGGQFTQAEGDRVFASFGISPTMDPSVRWSAFINGMNNLAAKYGLDVRIDESGRIIGPKNKSTLDVGQTTNVGGFKVTRRQ